MFSQLIIEYADPSNPIDSISLTYKLIANPVVPLWMERLVAAQKKYSIDDPKRFYGFGPLDIQIKNALDVINSHIDTINSFAPVIDKKLKSVEDQNTLNYLHYCFETYHGLLDKQDQSLFAQAPNDVKLSLRELNVSVHRCESIARGAKPRHVVTYYGLPKTHELEIDHYKHFTDCYEFGTVYINYVEIGKTLENLSIDNDHYITDAAFKPFRFYSADFTVLFYNSSLDQINIVRDKMKLFYQNNYKFFMQRNLQQDHPYLTPGRIPVAKLVSNLNEQEILNQLSTRQFVKSVSLQ
jgi:hypothetical protein